MEKELSQSHVSKGSSYNHTKGFRLSLVHIHCHLINIGKRWDVPLKGNGQVNYDSHWKKFCKAIKIFIFSPDQCGSVGWVSFYKVKGHWFDPWSGHMTALQVQFMVRVHKGGNLSMIPSHISVSLPLFLPHSPLSENK